MWRRTILNRAQPGALERLGNGVEIGALSNMWTMEPSHIFLGAAAIITNSEGAILLVHHTYGPRNWEIPGGGREPGESAVDTVMREVQEETGLAVTRVELAGAYYEPASQMHHFTFRCSIVVGADPRPDRLEISECRFWPTADLPRPMTDFTARRIADAINQDSPPGFHVVGLRHLLA